MRIGRLVPAGLRPSSTGAGAAQTLAKITDAQVGKMLGRIAEEVRIYDRAELRDFLGSILDRVELGPTAATVQVCYRIPLHSGNKLASPGGVGSIPTIVARSLAKIA